MLIVPEEVERRPSLIFFLTVCTVVPGSDFSLLAGELVLSALPINTELRWT